MQKSYVGLLMAGLFVLCHPAQAKATNITWYDVSGARPNIKAALVNPDNPRVIYAGFEAGVSKTDDAGEAWRDVLFVRGRNQQVNFLVFDLQDKNSLYAATANGLFFSPDQGRHWSRIFKGKGGLENDCAVLEVLPYAIYLGTKAGLFWSKDRGRTWHKEAGRLGNSSILAIACNLKEPACVYVACADGVFKTGDSGSSWERVFVSAAVERIEGAEEPAADEEETGPGSRIRYIAIDPDNPDCLYLAVSSGIYASKNRGKSWQALSGYGLLDNEVRFLSFSPDSRLYALTKAGIFRHEQERWFESSLGLVAGDINSIAFDSQDNIYAACEKGLFKGEANPYSGGVTDRISLIHKDGPAIDDLRQAAIRYAEVEPEKIMRWRKLAARRALLPKVSAGINRDTSDLWHWESGSTTRAGDDLLTKGRDTVNWDLTLTWDLSELIWNDAQTSIDVRSRLMVELRNDILDELTRLYFERLRVKMELDSLSIEERKKRQEHELRLKELAASLDGLTGGYFSGYAE